MLKCRNCVRNHLQTLLSIHASPPPPPPLQSAARSFSFSAAAASKSSKKRRQAVPKSILARKAFQKDGGEFGIQTRPGSAAHKPQLDSLKVSIPLEGGYKLQTRDPLRVLSEVKGLLERRSFDKALALVEKLTGKIETIHSWNALIKNLLDRGKVLAALKLYNDMKKRQVKPDAYTYSHLFAGLAAQPVIYPSYLKAADKLYEYAKNTSPGQEASPLHVNAYLTVCMRAGDIERAWKLLSELPQSGRNAPDAATFTIFLRALRGHGEEALGDGKRVWSGILSRWRKGDLKLDEYLLNSYLELLLHGGTAASWQEVFTVARQWVDFPYPEYIPTPGPNDPKFLSSARPDDFTLGIILKAAEKLKNFQLAEITWNTLTERYGLQPSAVAKHLYLRCASIAHDGEAAARFLSEATETTEWDFVMGLKACVTSGGIHESYRKAETILAKAEEAEQAGVLVVRTFLLVALTTCDGGVIKRALRRIERSLRPSNLEVWEKTMRELPREPAEIVKKFLATLKKAIFWDTVKYGRHEESRYMDKFREVKKIMKGWEGVRAEEPSEEEEEEEVDEEEEERKDTAMVFDGIARKQGDQPVSEENDRLYQAMAHLRRHTPAQRRKFISSL